MGRKGYTTIEQQLAANQRYLDGSEEARIKKRKGVYKSNGKRFILEFAEYEELLEYENYIKARKKTLSSKGE